MSSHSVLCGISNSVSAFKHFVPPSPTHPEDFCKAFQDDFKNVAFYEIPEGSTIYAFYENDEWRLSSNEDNITDDELFTVVASFKDACKALNVDLERDLDKNFVYSFVYQTPYYKYVNKFLYSYEIYIVAIYLNRLDTFISYDLTEFTAYKYTYDVACYVKNKNILFPCKLTPNFDNLELIRKEWGVGDGLPLDILDNDDYDRSAFIHRRGEKGISMFHIPSGTTSEVLNRHYLNFIHKENQKEAKKTV